MQFSLSFDASRLLAALQRFPFQVSKELRIGLKTALRTITTDARLHHRFVTRTGKLERSMRYEVGESGLEGRAFLDSGIAPHAAPVHEGSRPHIIARKTRKTLYWVSGGEKHFSRSVRHPGTKPDQFLFQAAERQRPFVRSMVKDSVLRAFKIAGI
jgi:hypothetical protein